MSGKSSKSSSVKCETIVGDPIEEIWNEENSVTLTVDGFGTVKDPFSQQTEVVRRYTWNNGHGMSVQVITYGATITTIKVPSKDGVFADVVLGFDDMEGYLQPNNPYFGCAVGRVANRIDRGEFCLNGRKYELAKNLSGGVHHLHGGVLGFNKFNWIPHVEGTILRLTHMSPDDFEGYPGTVMTTISYQLKDDNAFHISYMATSSKPTPINLTNHTYFNLAGHGAGHEEIYRHVVSINADKITETDANSIPSGRLLCVGGTSFDLRIPTQLGPAMAKTPTEGYDDNFCVTKGTDQSLAFVARVLHPKSGRVLEVYSDQPGVQFYTANSMPDSNGNIHPKDFYEVSNSDITILEPVRMKMGEQPINGKANAKYQKHGAFCLETQKYPDAVHRDEFPSIILNPGDVYKHEAVFKFDLINEK